MKFTDFAAYLLTNLEDLEFPGEPMSALKYCYRNPGAGEGGGAPCFKHGTYGLGASGEDIGQLIWDDGGHLTPAADELLAAWVESAIRTDMTALSSATGPKNKETLLQKIVALQEQTGDFNSFLMAVLISDPETAEALSSNGQHTLLMPTDAAFGALGGTINNLDNEDGFVSEIVSYHIVKGRLSYDTILSKKKLNTLHKGKAGFISHDRGLLTDNLGGPASFVETDIEVSNGVIHVIDSVLFHRPIPD